ncbi:copper homeostasis protein CutC [Paenibacillus pinistramenti]|uniref:copper homeostasis protein CutC n=1 Tax=Paenibacillus pinistramenti TaxID=1768003 RepID=UPI0011091A80|nr:copper homeostasis protein CutC [Paenibacillus pinistramenti]
MLLEIIAACVEDAIIAEQNGADRIELITAITEGGLTPGIGMVRQAVRTVRIPVHVMVRPHSRSFVYDEADQAVMAEEIRAIKDAGAAGIVIGALTSDGQIDQAALERWLPLTEGMNVTFHRAFDELSNLLEGLEVLQQYPQVNRILTSGGPKPAPQAVPVLRELVRRTEQAKRSGRNLTILAGHGLTAQGIGDFVRETGVEEVHFGTAVRCGGDGLKPIDPVRLSELAGRLREIAGR